MTLFEAIRNNAKTARRVGYLLLGVGVVAIVAPFAAGVSLVLMVGALLVAGGIAKLVLAVQAGLFGEGLLLGLLGLLSVVVGGFIMVQPLSALGALTVFLAAYFVASGIIQVIAAFGARGARGWGWLVLSALVSVALGLMIWRQFPLSGVWAVGTLVGIQLLMTGWLLIIVGGAVRSAADQAVDSDP